MKWLTPPLGRLWQQVEWATIHHFICNTKWKALRSFTEDAVSLRCPEKPAPVSHSPAPKPWFLGCPEIGSEPHIRSGSGSSCLPCSLHSRSLSEPRSHWQTPAQNHRRKRIRGTTVPGLTANVHQMLEGGGGDAELAQVYTAWSRALSRQ